MLIPVGLDLGNRRTKIHLLGKSASIPSVIGLDKPIVLGKSDTEIKAQAFSLFFRVDGEDNELWFGRDVLASENYLEGLDQIKYNKSFIQRLFQATLYQWWLIHKTKLDINLNDLGKLNIVTSMPPGQYQQTKLRNKALSAYKSAFNTGQSHMQLRPANDKSVQIVTQFGGLEQEAVYFGLSLKRDKKLILIVDLGGGTTDTVLLNGSDKPLYKRTYNAGLRRIYRKSDSVNPQHVELAILNGVKGLSKNYYNALIGYYNAILNLVVDTVREIPKQPDEIYIIGGGAKCMPSNIQTQFKQLADKVIIRDQYVNAISNWKEAGKKRQ